VFWKDGSRELCYLFHLRPLDGAPQKGLKLYFLPPYRPELNRIEKLWHNVKYELMGFKSRNAKTLEEDVRKILDGFGTDYGMTY